MFGEVEKGDLQKNNAGTIPVYVFYLRIALMKWCFSDMAQINYPDSFMLGVREFRSIVSKEIRWKEVKENVEGTKLFDLLDLGGKGGKKNTRGMLSFVHI